MTLSINFPFNTPGNYSFDPNKIEVTGGKAQLKLSNNPGQIFSQDFSDNTGFNFDNTKAEFGSGRLRQKLIPPSGSTFYANFSVDENGTTGNGDLTGTLLNGATISNGRLDCRGGTSLKKCDFLAVNNADSQQQGALEITWVPNYTGFPPDTQVLAGVFKGDNERNNHVTMTHDNDGNARVIIRDQNDVLVLNQKLGIFNAVAGSPTTWQLNFDLTLGEVRLFIDGFQIGSTQNVTVTRDNNIFILRVGAGANPASTAYPDFEIEEVKYFNTVQNTANYTISLFSPYQETKIDLPPFLYAGGGAFQELTDFQTVENNSPKYILEGFYWNGIAWVTSDGSYVQASDKTEVLNNLSGLGVSGDMDVSIVFPDSESQSSVENLEIEYTGQIFPTDNPSVKPFASIPADGILDFISIINASGSDEVRFTLEIDSVEKYFDGVNWSNGSGYAQSNSANEIKNNLASLGIELGTTIKFKIYLHSEDGTSSPEIDDLTFSYDFFGGDPNEPQKCIVYGIIYDSEGNPVEGVKVSARLEKPGVYKKEIQVTETFAESTTNSKGYWELSLIETVNMSPSQTKYKFKFLGTGLNFEELKRIPNAISKNYGDLV